MKALKNSYLYFGKIWHSRLAQKKHYFSYSVFLWYLDFDDLEKLGKGNWLIGREKFSLFSFYEKDHGRFYPNENLSLKQKIFQYLNENNYPLPHKIKILTNLRILGYVFNPVSFFFLLDREEKAYAVLVEVNNTFGEQKAYILPLKNNVANGKKRKWFYVSPFIRHDSFFVFHIKFPSESLAIQINTENEKEVELKARLWGKRKYISLKNLFWAFFRYPLHTIFVIGFIHWHAFLLYLKKIPYFKKKETDEAIRIAQRKIQLKEEHHEITPC